MVTKLASNQIVGNVANPLDHGAIGDGIANDTVALQAMIDDLTIKAIDLGNNSYAVTKLILRNNKEYFGGKKAKIIGIASVATNAVMEWKGMVGTVVQGIVVTTAQNQNYTCGVHWYTNDVNTYYPGKCTIRDVQINECLLGMNVGMLDSQTTYYASGTVQAAGVATDAPISECSISGLRITDCPSAFRIDQPNGKLHISDSYIASEGDSWASPPAETQWYAIKGATYGEVLITTSSVECLQSTTGSLVSSSGTLIYIDNSIVETESPCRLEKDFKLKFSRIGNFGFNSTTKPLLLIHSNSKGYATFSDTWVVWPASNLSAGSSNLAKGVSNLSTESYAEAPNAAIYLNSTELRDCSAQSAWKMLSTGVKFKASNSKITSYSYPGGVIQKDAEYFLDNCGYDALAALIDQASNTVTAYPQTSTPTTVSGLTFTVSASGNWGSQAPSATLVLNTINGAVQTPTACIRLDPTTGTVTAATPSFPLSPYSSVLVTGWVKGSGSANQIGVQLKRLNFSGGVVDTVNLLIGAESLLPSAWIPFYGFINQATNASLAQVVLYAEAGADVEFFGIKVYVSNYH